MRASPQAQGLAVVEVVEEEGAEVLEVAQGAGSAEEALREEVGFLGFPGEEEEEADRVASEEGEGEVAVVGNVEERILKCPSLGRLVVLRYYGNPPCVRVRFIFSRT